MVAKGSFEVKKAYLGSTEISAAYLGNDMVFGTTDSVTVDLNGQWRTSTSVGNLSLNDYEFFESYSNYNIGNGMAEIKITINGYTDFSFYIRNYAESNYDFAVVLNLDDTTTSSSWTTNPSIDDGTWSDGTWSDGYVYKSLKKTHSATNWTTVTFSNLDGGEHLIRVIYGKDSSYNSNDDRAYVAIDKEYNITVN